MKLAITSDIHLGDPLCSMVKWDGNDFKEGPEYKYFREKAGTGNDYLILLGDILDFSVTSYAKAYRAGKVFFSLVQRDRIADQIIYVPGNHDYDIWNIVENEVNIIHQMRKGKVPRKFRTAVPGILDYRTDTKTPGLTLPGVGKREDGTYTYGGLFLDHITDEPSHFIFCYPNLYLATDEGTIMMTHGQYLDKYWSLLSEWAPFIFKRELKLGTETDIQELVGMNFPLNQLACSGVGQAGVLTEVLAELQEEIKRGETDKSWDYLNNLDNIIDEYFLDFNSWYRLLGKAGSDMLTDMAKRLILEKISNIRKVRYNEFYFITPEVHERFLRYFNASLVEIEDLRKLYNIYFPDPDKIIFGHTHQPIPKKKPLKLKVNQQTVSLLNTGGWLSYEEEGKTYEPEAEVISYWK